MEKFASPNVAIAYLYLEYEGSSHNQQIRQSALKVMGSVLMQWVNHRKVINPAILDLYDKYGRGSDGLKSPTLEELASCLNSVAASFTSSFIILDALDVLEKKERNQILTQLKRLDSVRVFATCRPHLYDVQKFFEGAPVIEIKANNDDLKLYLAQQWDLHMAVYNEKLKPDVINNLAGHANGL